MVGSGDNREEFECYKIAMCFASPYFDGEIWYVFCISILFASHHYSYYCYGIPAMLSASMTENNNNRIEFPDKDPDTWRLFYQFIDPKQIGNPSYYNSINYFLSNHAEKLVPWFHEFQMSDWLKKCDEILSNEIEIVMQHVGRFDASKEATNRKSVFSQIIKLLGFACIYDLDDTKAEAELVVEALLSNKMLAGTQDLFDLSTVNELTELFLPLAEAEEGDGETTRFVSQGKSKVFWDMLVRENFEDNQLQGLSVKDINSNPMLPMFIKTFIERCALVVLSKK